MTERKTIYIDDRTGRQIASPEDARTGGAQILRGDDADRWVKDNPDLALKEEKEVEAPAENKARGAGANKGAKA